MLARVLLVAVPALLASVAPASAVTVRSVEVDRGVEPMVELIDAEGRDDRLELRHGAAGLIVTDLRGRRLDVREGCRRRRANVAVCAINPLAVDLGGGDDRLRVVGRFDLDDSTIEAGPGDDVVRSTQLGVLILGGTGRDVLQGGRAADRLVGGAGRDVLTGGRGDDVLTGDGPDDLDALSGAEETTPGDTVVDDDVLDGGPGRDTADYAGRDAPVRVRLAARGTHGAAGESDRLRSLEDARGGDGADVLTGDRRANRLQGGNGEDRLAGLGGDDTLSPGAGTLGSGTADCGAGRDVVTAPGRIVLEPDCERVAAAALIELNGQSITAQPRRAGRGVLVFEVAGPVDSAAAGARAGIEVRRDGAVLGRSPLVRLRTPLRPVRVRLSGRLPADRVVEVVHRFQQDSRLPAAPSFAFRVRLR